MALMLKLTGMCVEGGVCNWLPPRSGITAGDQPASNIAFYQIQFFVKWCPNISPEAGFELGTPGPKSDALSTILPETGIGFNFDL